MHNNFVTCDNFVTTMCMNLNDEQHTNMQYKISCGLQLIQHVSLRKRHLVIDWLKTRTLTCSPRVWMFEGECKTIIYCC